MSEKFSIDGDSVRVLADLLTETELTEIEYQVGTHRIRLVRAGTPAPVTHYIPPAPHPNTPPPSSISDALPPVEARGEPVHSPMVGTVYLYPEPGAAPYVKVGSVVKKGDTLLIIEAMKVMNPIRAPRDGKVLEICAQDTSPVEFGEALLILE